MPSEIKLKYTPDDVAQCDQPIAPQEALLQKSLAPQEALLQKPLPQKLSITKISRMHFRGYAV